MSVSKIPEFTPKQQEEIARIAFECADAVMYQFNTKLSSFLQHTFPETFKLDMTTFQMTNLSDVCQWYEKHERDIKQQQKLDEMIHHLKMAGYKVEKL